MRTLEIPKKITSIEQVKELSELLIKYGTSGEDTEMAHVKEDEFYCSVFSFIKTCEDIKTIHEACDYALKLAGTAFTRWYA